VRRPGTEDWGPVRPVTRRPSSVIGTALTCRQAEVEVEAPAKGKAEVKVKVE